MKAEAKSLRFLGEGKELAVPFFQRHYVWEEENWDELLRNFEDSDITPFLGSIILKEESSKRSTIIDGQQRLTTITILAKAIYDSLTSASKEYGSGIRNGIENFLFYRNNAADDFKDSKIRIAHSRTDQPEYNRVIGAEMLAGCEKIDLDTINDNSSNVAQCYKFYREKLYGRGDEALKLLFNSMFDESRKVFVLIELEQGDVNEQTIFDTINRAGIRLSTADIIKNNFYKRLLDAAGTDQAYKDRVYDTYKTCWEDIFYYGQEPANVWEDERVFGNVKHTNLEFLLYCVACIKWGEDGDMFAKLEEVFERETQPMGYTELLDLAKEIKEYANIFKTYILDFKASLEDEQSSEFFKYNENVRRLLLILQKFGVQMFYPYVLMRLKDVNQNETDEQLTKDFLILESFVMRRKVSKRATHDYTSKCYEIIKNGVQRLIETDLAVSTAGISDMDMKMCLADTKDDAAKMILFWIELYRRKCRNIDVDALEYKFTLEHIMPKRWEPHWSNVPIIDKDEILSPTSDDGKHFRNTAIQSLGNKTLLLSSLNASIKNGDFTQKIDGDGARRPGYKQHTSLLITQEIVEMAASDQVWDEQHIEKRKNDLFNEFITLWPSFIDEVVLEEEPIVDDHADPVLENYTAEQLADAAILLDVIPVSSGVPSNKEEREERYLSQTELVKRVNVQAETVERYIREERLVPDRINQISECRNIKYFLESKLSQYAEKFGWEIINDENRKDFFMDMVRKMDMSYSYKPIFLKGLLDHADINGVVNAWHLVAYFRRFFDNRRAAKLIVEKKDSVYINPDISDEEILRNILIYPFKRFEDIGAVIYDRQTHEIRIDTAVWSNLSAEEKKEIITICDCKLEAYFVAL